MFFKRRKHPLPKFPATVAEIFWSLVEALPEQEMVNFKNRLDQAMIDLEEKAERNNTLNIQLARELAQRCDYLIMKYSDYDKEKKALIVGVVRYFAVAEDPFPEEEFATGFDDDARVMNYVLEELGINNWYIDLPR